MQQFFIKHTYNLQITLYIWNIQLFGFSKIRRKHGYLESFIGTLDMNFFLSCSFCLHAKVPYFSSEEYKKVVLDIVGCDFIFPRRWSPVEQWYCFPRYLFSLVSKLNLASYNDCSKKRSRMIPRQFRHDILPQKDIVERIDRVDLQGVVLILGITGIDYDAVYAGAEGRREL